MDKDLENLPSLAKDVLEENKKYFQKLKKRTPKRLDLLMQELHDEEFEKTDCWIVEIVVKQQVRCLRTKILSVFLKSCA